MQDIGELTALIIFSSPSDGCNFQKHIEYETRMIYASQLLSPSLFLSPTCDGVTSKVGVTDMNPTYWMEISS